MEETQSLSACHADEGSTNKMCSRSNDSAAVAPGSTSNYSSFNEDVGVVLLRRPDARSFNYKYQFLSDDVRGHCFYIERVERRGGDGSASNASNILFVCDRNNHRVVAIDATTGALIRTVYGDGNKGSGHNQLKHPEGICLLAPNSTGSCGNISDDEHPLLFIADGHNDRVQVVNSRTGALVGSVGGNGKGARSDQFDYPTDICIGPSSSNTCADPLLFVVDYSNHRVQVFNAKTLAYVHTIGGGRGQGPGQFNSPRGICIGDFVSTSNSSTSSCSSDYSIFVADSLNHRISVFNAASGSFIRTIGSTLGVRGNRPGQFDYPMGVYYLPAGAGSSNPNGDPHIYVADSGNKRVAIFNANSGALVRHIDVGNFTTFLLPATTSDGDSFIYVSTTVGYLKIIYENNYALVFQFLYLLNHKTFQDFVFNLNYELREELVESLSLEML